MLDQPANPAALFDRLQWLPDRMLLDDLVFRLQHYKNDQWDGGEHFNFYKIEKLVDQYAAMLKRRPDLHPAHIFELGIWDGGSTAFWFEVFHPAKYVAVDLLDRKDSPYFDRYVASRGLEERVRTYWNTNQAQQDRLLAIVNQDLGASLDLVIDDASHLYWPTLRSFEVLFPCLSPGGLYIIEDWAWGHWPEFFDPKHPFAEDEPLTRIITELIEATGTSTAVISSVTVYEGFAVVERGPVSPETLGAPFTLESHIKRRPERISVRNIAKRVRRKLLG